MKLNPITKNPEIMRGVFEIKDGKFMHANPYGYITNLKDPEIHAEYICLLYTSPSPRDS